MSVNTYYFFYKFQKKPQIHVNLLHVVQIQFVTKEMELDPVLVLMITLVILTKAAGLSAY